MPVQETSLDAFLSILPSLNRRQNEILNLFSSRPDEDLTNREIAKLLGWSVCSVTPRVCELRDKSVLELARKRKCSVTNMTVYAWRLKQEHVRM